MTSHSAWALGLYKMREESESGITKWEEVWLKTTAEDGEGAVVTCDGILFYSHRRFTRAAEANTTRKLSYRKDDRAMRPTWMVWKFKSPWVRPRLLFRKFLTGFVPIDNMNVHIKFQVRSFTRSWDNKGYFKTLGSPWIRPRSWDFVRMDRGMHRPNL